MKKIKNLKIILKKTIVIITFNNFNFKFEIYLIIINNKTRIEKKLLKFDTFIKVLQKKKLRLQNIEIYFNKVLNKKFDCDKRENYKNFKKNDRENKKNNNYFNEFNINFIFVFHLLCDISYFLNKYSNKNVICNNI